MFRAITYKKSVCCVYSSICECFRFHKPQTECVYTSWRKKNEEEPWIKTYQVFTSFSRVQWLWRDTYEWRDIWFYLDRLLLAYLSGLLMFTLWTLSLLCMCVNARRSVCACEMADKRVRVTADLHTCASACMCVLQKTDDPDHSGNHHSFQPLQRHFAQHE